MNTRRCQVFRNMCVISENLLNVFSPHKALYCVKWYANPAGTELSVRSCAPSRRHRCAYAVCRGSACCSVSQRHNEGGLKSPFRRFSQAKHLCHFFFFYFIRHIPSFVFLKQSDNVRGGIFWKGPSFCLCLGTPLIFPSCGFPLRLLNRCWLTSWNPTFKLLYDRRPLTAGYHKKRDPVI